jgi:hypothetical protein
MITRILGNGWAMEVNMLWATLLGEGQEDQYNFGSETADAADVRIWATKHRNVEHLCVKSYFDKLFKVEKPVVAPKVNVASIEKEAEVPKKNYEERLEKFLERKEEWSAEYNVWLSNIKYQIEGMDIESCRKKLQELMTPEYPHRAWLSDLIGTITY